MFNFGTLRVLDTRQHNEYLYSNMIYTKQLILAFVACILSAYACTKSEPQPTETPEVTKREQVSPERSPEKPKPDTEQDRTKDSPKDTPPTEEEKPKDPPADNLPAGPDTPKDTPSPSQRSALVEHKYTIADFVGQDCHNCYDQLVALKKDKERQGDKLALVTMHPSDRRSPDLYHPEASAYLDALIGRRSVPQLAFNTLKNNPEGVYDMLDRPDAIALQASLQRSGYEVTLRLSAQQRVGQEARLKGRSLRLLIWVLEDEVIAAQIDEDATTWIHDYKYDGVFRGSLNGLWGVDFSLGKAYELSYTLPSKLRRLDKSHLLILICDASTHEALDISSLTLAQP